MRKCFVPLALAIATLYLTLSVGAVACLFAHESQPRSAHHHTGRSDAFFSVRLGLPRQSDR